MKSCPCKPNGRSGSSLIEVVIAVGVMAVAIPLVFGALAESGKSGMAAEAETRSVWMVPQAMDEIHASRDGRSQYFPATSNGEVFPPAGAVWGLAFSSQGSVVGKVTKADYDQGVKNLNGTKILYLLTMSATLPLTQTSPVPMLNVKITMEYPSGAPANRRQKLDFYTHTP